MAMCLIGIFLIIGAQQWVYARSTYATRGGQIALLALMTLVAVGVIANVHYFTWQSGGTDSAPVLMNNDARRYWNDALYYSGLGGEQFDLRGSLLGFVYGQIFRITGSSITLLTLINFAMMAVTLPVIASLTFQLTQNRRTATTAFTAAGCVCYFLVSGCIIIKDMSIIMSTALCARGLADNRGIRLRWIVGGLVPLALVRPNYIALIIPGMIIMTLCRKQTTFAYVKAGVAIVMGIAIMVVMTVCEVTLAAPEFGEAGIIQHFSYAEPNQVAYQNMIGTPDDSSVIRRILLMPLAAVVQFLIPFPWNWTLHADFGYTYIYAHCAYPWYLFGAVVLYYLFTCRRYRNNSLLWFTVWGLLCWWAPCYFTSGTVSRYALPAVSILAPCVATVINTRPYRRSLGLWLAIFCAGMTVVLLICHHLQASAMQ